MSHHQQQQQHWSQPPQHHHHQQQQQQQHQQQHQEPVCTCPHEVQQAMQEAQFYWSSNRPLPREILDVLTTQSSVQQHVQAFLNRTSGMEAQMTGLASWQLQQHQQQHQQQHILQHQQQFPQLRQRTSPPVRSAHAPSNSSLDSAFSGQSNNSDASGGSAAPQGPPLVARLSRESVETLRQARRDAAQLKAEFQGLRAAHDASVRAMNDLFADRMACIRTFTANLQARQLEDERREAAERATAKLVVQETERIASELFHGRETVLLDGAVRNRWTPAAPSPRLQSRTEHAVPRQQLPAPASLPPNPSRVQAAGARESRWTPTPDQWRALLRSIETFSPDREARMRSVWAIESYLDECRRSCHRPALTPSPQPPAAASGVGGGRGRQQRQRAVAFSNTVKVDDGSELIRLNCPEETRGAREEDAVWERQTPPPTAHGRQARGAKTTQGLAAGLHSLNCGRPVANKR